LGGDFADPVAPARFPQHVLRRRNQGWAAAIGLDTLSDEDWIAYMGRFEPLPGNMPAPLAMRYHGHQFRSYNPDLGDGRGFLFAQLRDQRGRLLDLGTKGSGQTPYSRRGDGRLTLKGGVREVLAAEMLEALRVNTSKALSLIETGEALVRGDEPSPTRSSVLVRLQHSHIRFGTFQRLAYFEREDLMRTLIGHCATAYYPQHAHLEGEAQAVALMGEIVQASARLAGGWMAAGFVHGVLNTDNLNVTGESFDYGPWRYLPALDPGFTAAYFDETGLYAYGRQPEAVSWALAQLGGALSLVCPTPLLEAELKRYAPAFQEGLRHAVFGRLNLAQGDFRKDLEFIQTTFDWLQAVQADFAQFFHDWYCGAASDARAALSPQAALYARADFTPVRDGLGARTGAGNDGFLAHAYWARPRPTNLLIEEVEALWAPIAADDDWSMFEAKLAEIEDLKQALGGTCHGAVAQPS